MEVLRPNHLCGEYYCSAYPFEERIVILLRYLAVTSKARKADPAIWGILQVLDGQNPILPQLPEHSVTFLSLLPSIFQVLIKLTATRPGLLTIPQFS